MANTTALTWAAMTTPERSLGGQTPLAFFEEHIAARGDFGCWVWTGRLDRGYGKIPVRGEGHMAHRFSYVLHHGGIPDGLTLDHLCRVTSCVNPAHLDPVTQAVNSRRALGWHPPGWRKRRRRAS